MTSRSVCCLLLTFAMSIWPVGNYQSAMTHDSPGSRDGDNQRQSAKSRVLLLDREVLFTQNVKVCNERVGTGSCGGYNRANNANCDRCATADTYKCTDGSYVEKCTYDPKHCGC